MTVSELDALIARVLQPGFTGATVPDWVRRRLAGGLGSVILFATNVESPTQVRTLTDALRAENPDVFVAVDEEAGDITRLEHATGSSFPGNLALGTVDDVTVTEAVARAVGSRVRAAGIDVDYAPVADVNTEPRNPVIGARSFGSDPDLVARHVAAAVRGLHAARVAACAKHFPGHGDTTVDSHVGLPRFDATLAELERDTLPPFRAALAAGARAVMVAHLLMPAFDAEHPASASPAVIGGLLRTELGFEGLAVSDGIGMAAVKQRYGLAGAAVRALSAGIDLVCIDNGTSDADMAELTTAITAALRDGTLAEARLAEAAERITAFARWRRQVREGGYADGIVEDADGLAVARRAVRVLRVEDGVLPLKAAPHVAEADLPRSLADRLSELLPGTTRTRLADTTDVPDDRPLVIAVRGIQRSPDQLALVTRLIKQRPDAIVVDLGVPHTDPGGAAWIAGYGVSRVSLQAVAELLAGQRIRAE
jgi:beta-N-acetylhexosaminidase